MESDVCSVMHGARSSRDRGLCPTQCSENWMFSNIDCKPHDPSAIKMFGRAGGSNIEHQRTTHLTLSVHAHTTRLVPPSLTATFLFETRVRCAKISCPCRPIFSEKAFFLVSIAKLSALHSHARVLNELPTRRTSHASSGHFSRSAPDDLHTRLRSVNTRSHTAGNSPVDDAGIHLLDCF